MKVLHIINVNRKVEGVKSIAPFVVAQLDGLKREGLDVDILKVSSGFSPSVLKENYRLVKNQISENSYDVVHIQYGSLLGFFCSIIIRSLPVVISYGGSELIGTHNDNWKWKIKDLLSRYLSIGSMYFTQKIVVKSEELKTFVPKSCLKKVALIPNGVRISSFEAINRKEVRQKYEFNYDEFVLLFNLRRGDPVLERVKNWPLAKTTMEIFKSAHPHARMFIIQNRSHDETIELLCAADALLLTSLHEGSPNIVKESMAANLPVVTVNCGDVSYLLDGVNNSYVSKEYDTAELAGYLSKVVVENQPSSGRKRLKSIELDDRSVSRKLIGIYQAISKQ